MTFTETMTVLEAPSTAQITHGSRPAGKYVWEKAQTLKVCELTAEVRTRGGKPMDPFSGFEGTDGVLTAWYAKDIKGMTVRNGKLRFWGKAGSKFFGFTDPTKFDGKGMDTHIQAFLDRHNFARKSDNVIENLTWAYAPSACETFGLDMVYYVAQQLNHVMQVANMKDGTKEFLGALEISPRFRELADEAIANRDYAAVKTLMVASRLGFEGTMEKVLDLPFKASEVSEYDLRLHVDFRNIPAEVFPLLIRTYSDDDYDWFLIEQNAWSVSFVPGDDPNVWVQAVLEAAKNQTIASAARWRAVAQQARIDQAPDDIAEVVRHLSLLRPEEVAADLSRWREDGLLGEDARGLLVWKAVNKGMEGMLGFEYALDTPFKNGGMAAVGPWGAVKEYGQQDSYLLAIRATKCGPVEMEWRPGVWYVLEGTPVAQYLITEMDRDGFVPVLLAGTDEMEILTGFPSKKA